jgi:hypothetical protein
VALAARLTKEGSMRLQWCWRAVVIAVLAVCFGSSAWPSCAQARPRFEEFTSGSGWIPLLLTGGKGTFSLHAFQQDLTSTGRLVYTDHDIGFRVKSTSISSFGPGCVSMIMGTGDSSGGPVQFVVTVTDAGEPGAGSDTFSIQVFSGVTLIYSQGPLPLGGGNIQAHGLLCPPPL